MPDNKQLKAALVAQRAAAKNERNQFEKYKYEQTRGFEDECKAKGDAWKLSPEGIAKWKEATAQWVSLKAEQDRHLRKIQDLDDQIAALSN